MVKNKVPPGQYVSSIDENNGNILQNLEQRMFHYYMNINYHKKWILHKNANWHETSHTPQLEMCKLIPDGSRVLEVGCGDGSGAVEIQKLVNIDYIGVDLNIQLSSGQFTYLVAKADSLPFSKNSFDVVLSMFVIEHLVFPNRYLDSAWSIVKPRGRLIVLAPDYTYNRMPSERVGLSYGSGRDKLAKKQIKDAILTAYDSRLRIFLQRLKHRRLIGKKLYKFLIFTEPGCLYFPEFVPDCDAIHLVSPEEIINYMEHKLNFGGSDIFFRDSSIFGLMIYKD